MSDYKRSDMGRAIDEYVLNPRYRDLLRLRFCDGYTYEQIAGEVNYSPQHVKHICRAYKSDLMRRL